MGKISKEVAEQEFDRFADMMDLDLNTDDMDEEDRKGFSAQKGKVISAIQAGSLVVDEKGNVTFTPQRSEENKPITFYEPTGASLMAMDRKKKNQDIGKLYALMADITKTNAILFSQMKMGDLKVCQAVTTLFLG